MTRDDHDTLYAMADALKGVADLDHVNSRLVAYVIYDIPPEAIVNYDDAAIKIAREERYKWSTTLGGVSLLPCAGLAWFLAIIFAPSHAMAAESVAKPENHWFGIGSIFAATAILAGLFCMYAALCGARRKS